MIIGMTGLMGAGKDSVANDIIAQRSSYIKLPLTIKLKDMVSALYGWDRSKLDGATPEDRAWREQKDALLSDILGMDVSPRQQLQFFGLLLKEQIKPTFWSDLLRYRILNEKLKDAIVPDVRFPDDIAMVRSLGGIIIRVERGARPEWFSMLEQQGRTPAIEALLKEKNLHPTETGWVGFDQPDFIIQNDGTLDDLHQKVMDVLKQF